LSTVTTARPLDLDAPDAARPRGGDLVFRWPPNWTGVVFFAVLACLHLCICIPAFFHGRIEGYMSLIFATIFSIVSVLCLRLKSELAVLPGERMIRLRTRVWRFVYERKVPFASIRGVRLTLCGDGPRQESIIELLCSDDDMQCPPTSVPREEALCLAMTINVPLIKAYAGATPPARPA
jgi:hypothetical protein